MSSNKAAIQARIRGLVPVGSTALYATKAAHKELASNLDPNRINAVVLLTDGKNEFPPDNNIESVIDQLSSASEGTATAVRVFPIAYGDAANLRARYPLAATGFFFVQRATILTQEPDARTSAQRT